MSDMQVGYAAKRHIHKRSCCFHVFLYWRRSVARLVKCIKLGREAEGLDLQPYPGELGKRIFDNVSKAAWNGWIKHQTILVNENHLNLADIKARKYLAEQLEAYFFGAGAERPLGYVPPTK
jgi:Fe-S cluster biosynthesis and repair protein YggX